MSKDKPDIKSALALLSYLEHDLRSLIGPQSSPLLAIAAKGMRTQVERIRCLLEYGRECGPHA